MRDGTFITVADRPAVRFEREYGLPADEVWRAVADPERARRWFPSTLSFEPRVGGAVRFTDDPNMADGEGVVLEYEPQAALAFTWGGGEVRIAVRRVGDGVSRFVLTDVLADRDEAARNAAGWDVCLRELDAVLRGGDPRGPHADGGAAWRAAYARYAASGMPTGAPIPPSVDPTGSFATD